MEVGVSTVSTRSSKPPGGKPTSSEPAGEKREASPAPKARDADVSVIGLRVPGAIAYRHLAIRLVSTACKMALESDQESPQAPSADGDFEAEVVSAFGEAFNNIAVHGFRDRAPEPVQIDVDWDDEKLVITFVDNGHVFDPETVAPPDLDELPEHGMGLFIMRSCMDEVDYRPGPPNVLRLVKLRARRGSGINLVPGNDASCPPGYDPMVER
jgi:serine/threonine-protein kinase RsbW